MQHSEHNSSLTVTINFPQISITLTPKQTRTIMPYLNATPNPALTFQCNNISMFPKAKEGAVSLLNHIATLYGISPEHIFIANRHATNCEARQYYFYIVYTAYNNYNMPRSHQQIAAATISSETQQPYKRLAVRHAVQQISNLATVDKALAANIARTLEAISRGEIIMPII